MEYVMSVGCDDLHGAQGLRTGFGNISRRSLLCGLGAAVLAQPAWAASSRRIDVHHHIIPPWFLNEAPTSAGFLRNLAPIKDWTPQRDIEDLDRNDISLAVLSFPQPQIWSAEVSAQRSLARRCNDFFADMARSYPKRYGVFAGLPPLQDIEGCLNEIVHGLDNLGAQGVRLMTSYRDKWLGAPEFSPVFDELNRRHAVVFVHPDVATCCANITSLPFGHAELPFDTARSIGDYWYSGGFDRWPNIRFILSHGGGALSMVADRMGQFGRPLNSGPVVHDAMSQFQSLYFDTANAASAPAISALRAFARPSNVLFGTDTPFIDVPRQIRQLTQAGFQPSELDNVQHGNAVRLMPSLA
jgi:predicted TIM-barrel fold metal-dependent hydrolase